MKYVVLQMAQSHDNKLPVFIPLRDLSYSKLTIIDFIISQFEIGNFPKIDNFIKNLLYRGEATILFDGLDEVNHKQYKTIMPDLINLTNKYNKCQHIITARQWNKFKKSQQIIGQEYRQLVFDWELTSEKQLLLKDYISATKLLLDCLASTQVDRYEEIRELLLTPPLAF